MKDLSSRGAKVIAGEHSDPAIVEQAVRGADALFWLTPAGTDRPRPNVGPVVNADGGDPQDMLEVYDATLGTDSPPLWRGRAANGLQPPDMRLVKDLRTKVEAAAKKP